MSVVAEVVTAVVALRSLLWELPRGTAEGGAGGGGFVICFPELVGAWCHADAGAVDGCQICLVREGGAAGGRRMRESESRKGRINDVEI